MTPERFWELVATLGGRADDATTPALDGAVRASGEGDDFGDLVDEHVERLLQRCDVPPSHRGDSAEWIAAAVIAAGRETYERTLAAGAVLLPHEWQWEEAENLLVVGFTATEGEEESHQPGMEGQHLGVTLEWKTTDLPVGVTSFFDPSLDLFGDDPRGGYAVTADPSWAEAILRIDADLEFHRRRATISDVGLHLKVRECAEVALTPWPSDEVVDDVVMSLPRDLFTDAEQRVEVYVEAVVELVLSVQERLGRTGGMVAP